MSNKITDKDVYVGLCKCRDFEIDHVWQRAVFLSAFLLACYAGYGTTLVGFSTADAVYIPMQLVNALLYSIALAGLVLSLIWIMMAKGSKAWYEHYEAALKSVEEFHPEVFESNCKMRVFDADKTIVGFSRPPTSSWLWNTKGGSYSVAKINVVLGHVSAVVWLLIVILHIVVASKGFTSRHELIKWLMMFVDGKHLVAMSVGSMLTLWLYSLLQIKSSFLKDK